MAAIRIGCVPEHFSAPLLKALEDGTLNQDEVELVICKLGTGDMVKRLVSKELDIAICVTEGLVAGIDHNRELALFGTFVESPLPWAASVNTKAKYCTMDDLAFGARFGISRPGSGSEVMAKYAASKYEWKEQPKFEVLGGVEGLVRGIQEDRADVFLWERTTMQRHYQREEVRYLGTVLPPWPAFSYGGRREFIEANGDKLRSLLGKIGRLQETFMEAGNETARTEFICRKLGYAAEDVGQWAGYVQYSGEVGQTRVNEKKIEAVVQALTRAGVMSQLELGSVISTI